MRTLQRVKIEEFMEDLGVNSMTVVARATGINIGALSRYNRGLRASPGIGQLEALRVYFGLDYIDDLIEWSTN